MNDMKTDDKVGINAEKLEKIADIIKAIAHPLRIGILHILGPKGALSVSDICAMMESEQSLTYHHLQQMRLHGILSLRKEGITTIPSRKRLC